MIRTLFKKLPSWRKIKILIFPNKNLIQFKNLKSPTPDTPLACEDEVRENNYWCICGNKSLEQLLHKSTRRQYC